MKSVQLVKAVELETKDVVVNRTQPADAPSSFLENIDRVKEIYAQVVATQPTPSTNRMQDDDVVKTHGVLSPAARAHIRKRAHEQVIAPCMQMLLADSRPKIEFRASYSV